MFRLFALFPVLYEAASIVLRLLAARHMIRIPMVVFPLLTMKPPLTFLVFLALAAFVKIREKRFCQQGRTTQAFCWN